jgi:acyl carrier protein
MNADAIVADLAELLRDFQGREYSDVIGRPTRFFSDLGFASIDAVVLGETLEKRYGRKLPFHQLLAELGRRQAEDFTVGEMADFLARHLHPAPEV